jgi:hypothetical protein
MTFGAETDYHCEAFKIPDEWRTKRKQLVRVSQQYYAA